MKKFFGIFIVGMIAFVAGCDLQPKIASIPDDVGEFISNRYPTLLAEPDSEIYKTAVADYGVYASATEYGNGDVTGEDYVLYSPADDYMMPAQDTDVPDADAGVPEPDEEETEAEPESYTPDTDVDDLKIPDYVGGKPVDEPKPEKTEPNKNDDKTETPELMRAELREVTIEKGDTLYSISRKYSVPVNDLAVLNKISAPFALSVGQKIKVPDVLSVPKYNAPQVKAAVKPEPKIAAPEKVVTPKAGTKKVETKTAEVKKAEPKKVEQAQSKTKPADVKKVDDKKVEVKKTDTKTVDKKTTAAKKTDATKKETKTGPKKVDAKKMDTKKADVKKTESKKVKQTESVRKAETKQTAQKTETKKRTAKQLAARSSSKFSWPLRGKILSGFGSKPNGLVNDGINISGTKGSSVLAAENGFVAYAGNEVKGMGNLVIIQHADGWMTVYAHMDTMNVRRGSTVAVGQKIGTVGQSGKVDRPQLHFEIRKGTRAYNPISYLKK